MADTFPICGDSRCRRRHDPRVRCEIAARLATNEVVHETVVHNEPSVVVHRKGDRHKKTDDRRQYRREWTRADRARKAQA